MHKLEWGHGTRLASVSSLQLALKLGAFPRPKTAWFQFFPFYDVKGTRRKGRNRSVKEYWAAVKQEGNCAKFFSNLNYYFPRQTGRLPAPWGNFYGLKDKLHAVKIINFYSIPLFPIFITSFSVSFHVKLSYSPTTQSSKNFSHELRLRSSIKYR